MYLFRWIVLTLAVSLSFAAKAQEPPPDKAKSTEERASGPAQTLALSLITYYQTSISSNSVHRCPFQISCSQYACESIKTAGLGGGLTHFIDRYYYRENKDAFRHYPLAAQADGAIKLDDDFFLTGSSQLYGLPDWRCREYRLPGGYANDYLGWANQLFREHDYYRANTVYKEILFFAEDDLVKDYCRYQISRCLIGLGRYNDALSYISDLLADSSSVPTRQARFRRLSGLAYALQNLTPMADTEFRMAVLLDSSGENRLYLGWMEASREAWTDAVCTFSAAESSALDTSLLKKVSGWRKSLASSSGFGWKSPGKAALMSAVLPGSGQLYCEHAFDGIQAFTYVSLFSMATWAAYRYESAFRQPRIGTVVGTLVALTFHYANIWGAQQTAKYRNYQMREELLLPLRTGLIEWEFSQPPPD